MFRPAIVEYAVAPEQGGLRSRAWQPPLIDTSSHPVQQWHFPRIDIWPVSGDTCPTPSEFGPLMGEEPVADEARAPPLKPAFPHPESTPNRAKPRMILWLSPFYKLGWGRTEMEGAVRLAFAISSTGGVDEVEVQRSSGSAKLDAAAVQAAKIWRFAPAVSQGRPIESKATVELTFNFFEYRVSAIDEETISKARRRGAVRLGPLDGDARIRTLVKQIRSGTTDELTAPAYVDGRPSWPAAMRDWGPVSSVQYLGPIGTPEWRRYAIKSKARVVRRAEAVDIRWEQYRVVHGGDEALWEVGIDRTGAVWALKAEPLEITQDPGMAAADCLRDTR
jgi:TonB family protein